MRRLSLRLMTLQDEERRRLARDLHDTTGQTLVGIKMTMASLRQTTTAPEQLRLIDEVNALMDEASREIRTTSSTDRRLLDEAGIASAGRWFVEGFAKRSGITSTVLCRRKCSVPLGTGNGVVPSLARESYQRSSPLWSLLCQHKTSPEEERIILEVRDNGRGIPQNVGNRFTM